jgi:hypothetical protein
MTTTNEVPTFQPDGMDLPTRKEMLEALQYGLESVLFHVHYLSDGQLTNVDADRGGLERNASLVEAYLQEASRLVKMYDALRLPEKSEEQPSSGPRAA